MFEALNLGELGEQLRDAAKAYTAFWDEVETKIVLPFRESLYCIQDDLGPLLDFIRRVQKLPPEERFAFADLVAEAYAQ